MGFLISVNFKVPLKYQFFGSKPKNITLFSEKDHRLGYFAITH